MMEENKEVKEVGGRCGNSPGRKRSMIDCISLKLKIPFDQPETEGNGSNGIFFEYLFTFQVDSLEEEGMLEVVVPKG